MEFPFRYLSGIHLVDDFSEIAWKTYPLKRRDGDTADEDQPNPSHLVWRTETSLREKQALVFVDGPSQVLWLFRPTKELENVASAVTVGQSGSGTLIASQLAQLQPQSSNQTNAQDPITPVSSPNGTLTEKESECPDIGQVYQRFIGSVIAQTLFALARYRVALPLNPNWLLSFNGHHSGDDTSGSAPEALEAFQIRAQLTTAGALMLSFPLSAIEGLRPRSIKLMHEVAEMVLVAPLGKIARIVLPSINCKNINQTWQLFVQQWLGTFGIDLPSEQSQVWVKLQILDKEGHAELNLYWPAGLCLAQSLDATAHVVETSASEDDLRWFQCGDNPGYQDPVGLVQKWFLDKPGRREEIERSRVESQLESISRNGHEGVTDQYFDFATPSGYEHGIFRGSQAIAAIYPTPPDGYFPQATSTQVQFAQTATPSTWQGRSDDSHAVGETDDANAARDGTMPHALTALTEEDEGLERADSFHEDDLFGDTDEVQLGVDLTDADFSFFDRPDVANPQESAITPTADFSDAGPPETEARSHKSERQTPNIAQQPGTDRDDLSAVSRNVAGGGLNEDNMNRSGQSRDWTQSNKQTKSCSQTNNFASGPLCTPAQLKDEFRPDEVENDITMTSCAGDVTQIRRSVFSAVDLTKIGFRSDTKYDQNGRFGYLPNPQSQPRNFTIQDLLSAQTAGDSDLDDSESDSTIGGEGSTAATISASPSDVEEYPLHLGYSQGQKRKRDSREDADYSEQGEKMWRGSERLETADHVSEIYALLNSVKSLSISSNTDLVNGSIESLGSKKTKSTLVVPPFEISNRTVVFVAQIVADQAIQSTFGFRSSQEPWTLRTSEPKGMGSNSSIFDLSQVNGVVIRTFPHATHCDLLDLAQISDIASPGNEESPPTPNVQRRKSKADTNSGIFSIPAPFVRVQRGRCQWDLLPPAIRFWDSLGLGPCNGPKDVVACCVYPFSHDMAFAVEQFLEGITNVYEESRLGSHEWSQETLVRIKTSGKPTVQSALVAYQQACEALGHALSKANPKGKPIVVYVVNPFTDPTAVKYLCAAFWVMFEAYISSTKQPQTPDSTSDIVPQIVPINYIASFDIPIVQQPDLMALFAREVYDRCPPVTLSQTNAPLDIPAAASIELAESTPQNIPLKLVPDPPRDTLHEDSYLHIAYSQSSSKEWVTAAWTDNFGTHQSTVSYSLRGIRTFAEVAREIYDTTLDIIKARQVSWRLFFVKGGAIDKDEVETWISLFESTSPQHHTFHFIAIDSSTNLSLAMPPPSDPEIYDSQTSTPASCSDQHSNTPTPATAINALTPTDTSGQDLDPKAVLIDIEDETWGVLLSHRLNLSCDSTVYNPALASAYLVKRGGVEEQVLPKVMAVNLAWTDNADVTASRESTDALMRELLEIYRGLSLLARARGMMDKGKELMPWHVLAALRGVEALERCM